MIPYTLNDTGVTFFFKGKQKTFARDFPTFDELLQAIFNGDGEAIERLTNVKEFISRITLGDVVITSDDEVLYKGQEVPEYLAQRIIEQDAGGYPVSSLMAFAGRLMANPNLAVREDLYRWLENGNMPIYEDGHFMAYKRVNHDYTPKHKGPYGQDQSIGMVVEQPRDTCEENRGVTCASGLHFCSMDYLPQFGTDNFGTDKVIVLKIDPADVVAIPTDYNLTKGRTCRFEVVGEVDYGDIKERFGGTLVVGQDLSDARFLEADEDLDIELLEEDLYIDDDSWDENSWDDYYDEVERNEVADNKFRTASKALMETGGNKTAAAAKLGIARSTLSRWLEAAPPAPVPAEAMTAEQAIKNFGTKTAAAEFLGISRSTLNRRLAKGL